MTYSPTLKMAGMSEAWSKSSFAPRRMDHVVLPWDPRSTKETIVSPMLLSQLVLPSLLPPPMRNSHAVPARTRSNLTVMSYQRKPTEVGTAVPEADEEKAGTSLARIAVCAEGGSTDSEGVVEDHKPAPSPRAIQRSSSLDPTNIKARADGAAGDVAIFKAWDEPQPNEAERAASVEPEGVATVLAGGNVVVAEAEDGEVPIVGEARHTGGAADAAASAAVAEPKAWAKPLPKEVIPRCGFPRAAAAEPKAWAEPLPKDDAKRAAAVKPEGVVADDDAKVWA
jgi:hypothetical protein